VGIGNFGAIAVGASQFEGIQITLVRPSTEHRACTNSTNGCFAQSQLQMGPVERIGALGWVQNGKDARAPEAIFQHFPIISNLNLGLQKELGLWDGFRMGKTHAPTKRFSNY
jgi:hypothetical protein